MFDWLRRIFQSQKESERQHFFETIDALNAEGGGGRPTATAAFLGTLELRSKTLALGDPQYVPGLEVPNIDANEVLISASLWRYPSGAETLTALTLRLGDAHHRVSHRKIGEIGIDSAKLVVTDKIDIDQHWTEIGKERIGIISTAPDDTVLLMLTKHFGLKTIRVNPVRAEVVGPVSEALEMEIENYLKSQPRYADYPFLYFRVETNNSFERANQLAKTWEFMPVGNAPLPIMFVCGTGRGDGCYEVHGDFDGDVPRVLTIPFIEE